jgi:hypothetical protein
VGGFRNYRMTNKYNIYEDEPEDCGGRCNISYHEILHKQFSSESTVVIQPLLKRLTCIILMRINLNTVEVLVRKVWHFVL